MVVTAQLAQLMPVLLYSNRTPSTVFNSCSKLVCKHVHFSSLLSKQRLFDSFSENYADQCKRKFARLHIGQLNIKFIFSLIHLFIYTHSI